MSNSYKYETLFEVKMLHLFYLNKGTSNFHSMTDSEKSKQMKDYEFEKFLSITPSIKTAKKLKGFKSLIRKNGASFTVLVQVDATNDTTPFVAIDKNEELTFLLKLKDFNFHNYTGFNIATSDCLYFSNKRLSSESSSFPLIKIAGDNASISSDSVLSTDGKDEIDDVLEQKESLNCFAVLRIHFQGESSSLNVLDGDGNRMNPVFEVQFENRSTTWRYIFNSDQSPKNSDDVIVENSDDKILITETEKPLTNRGFISVNLGDNELPNPSSKLIKYDKTNSKYYSEVYI